ncbi:MAG TPA: LysM domain-containing protein, partial [Thermomicrobiaceae bacterium]|nr:LysM domain-containing protein [Thermomicrobiaceae bacterium]
MGQALSKSERTFAAPSVGRHFQPGAKGPGDPDSTRPFHRHSLTSKIVVPRRENAFEFVAASHPEPGLDPDIQAFITSLPKVPKLRREEPVEPAPEPIDAVSAIERPRTRLRRPVVIAAHAALLLAIVVIVLGHGYWSASTTTVRKGGTDTAGDPRDQPIPTAVSLADSIGAMNAALPPSTTMTGYVSQPASPITPAQLSVKTITSKAGDTPAGIARETGRSVDTILWANGLSDPSKPLDEGTQIQVPPVDGMLHLVRNGDTLQSIA